MRTRQEYEALLANPNVQRGLAVIRYTEGTARHSDPYSITFGDRKFDTSKGHPGTLYPFRTKSGVKKKTSAHGAYQFLRGTWGRLADRFGFKDMSKTNQDVAALALIDEKGAIDDLVQGNVKQFVETVGPVWASLPSAPREYDQPTKGWNKVLSAWESAAPEPVERTALASLPVPSDRPNGGLLSTLPTPEERPEQPSLLSALNPVSSAHAGEMPKGSLLQPAPRPTSEPTRNTAHPYANAAPLGTAVQPGLVTQPQTPSNATLADAYSQYGQSRSLAPKEPIQTIDQYAQEFDEGVAANPESMTDAEFADYQLSQPKVALSPDAIRNQQFATQPAPILQAPTSVAPAPTVAPVQAPSMLPAPQDPYTLQQQAYTPPPPQNSAMDVWRGDAQSGVDSTGAYSVNRADDGNFYRYSEKYDRTDILNPDGSYRGQKSGKIDGPVGGGEINTPSLGNPFGKAKTADGAYVRGILGATAGGMAGSFVGPVGGILGSLIGRNIAQGQGLLSLQGAASKMTPGHSYRSQYNGPPITATTFPDVPDQAGLLTANKIRNNSSLYDPNAGGLSASEEAARRDSISPRAATHVQRGGAALF